MGLAYTPASTPIRPQLFELFPVLKQMLGRRGVVERGEFSARGLGSDMEAQGVRRLVAI